MFQESFIVVAKFLLVVCALALIAVLLATRVLCSRLTDAGVSSQGVRHVNA